MEELLAYDVTGNSPLFGDDRFMEKSTKSELVTVRFSEGPFFRRFIVPKVHCSEGSLFRKKKVYCAEGLLVRRVIYPK